MRSNDHLHRRPYPIGEKGFYLVGVPGPAGWQPPVGFLSSTLLPGRLGGGYWVRYMVQTGAGSRDGGQTRLRRLAAGVMNEY